MSYKKTKDENEILSYENLLIRLKETEEKLKESTKESERLKSQFLANISHEIRTPMNAILGFSELLRDTELSEEDRNNFIDSINDSSQKLLNTIDNILHTAIIESKEISYKEESCDINQLMNELFDSYNKTKGNIGKGHIELRLKKEANGNPGMLTDISKLRQILSNLIDNALKFTEKGHIEFGYEFPDKKNIQFFVKDTGIGIPTDKYNIIFEKFSKVGTIYNIKQSGLGVGLSISHNYTNQLGGTMNLRSRLKRGSEFFFSIPYIPAELNSESDQKADWISQLMEKPEKTENKIGIYSNWSNYSA